MSSAGAVSSALPCFSSGFSFDFPDDFCLEDLLLKKDLFFLQGRHCYLHQAESGLHQIKTMNAKATIERWLGCQSQVTSRGQEFDNRQILHVYYFAQAAFYSLSN